MFSTGIKDNESDWGWSLGLKLLGVHVITDLLLRFYVFYIFQNPENVTF